MDLQEASTLPESQMCRRVASPQRASATSSVGDSREPFLPTGNRADAAPLPALLLSPSTSVLLASLEGGSNEIIFKDWDEASFRNRPSRHCQVFTGGHKGWGGRGPCMPARCKQQLVPHRVGPAGPGKRDSNILRAIEW